ncbi:carbonic anhydrase [Myxococcota bacterium]|nr:carbonic anhydrase [Myxococcota bacterium]
MKSVAFFSALSLVALAGCASTAGNTSSAADAPPISTKELQAKLTPAEIRAQLEAGNQRFAAGQTSRRDHLGEVKQTSTGQFPKAVILSCLDSRIPPELVFDQGIGDLFVARVAGNFENTDILGSMEFATAAAGAKLIVVMGHTECGAVKGACDRVKLGNLTDTLANITPAVEDAEKKAGGTCSSKIKDHVHAVTHLNIERTVQDITKRSEVLAKLVAEGKLAVVGAHYDLATGKVEWIDATAPATSTRP